MQSETFASRAKKTGFLKASDGKFLRKIAHTQLTYWSLLSLQLITNAASLWQILYKITGIHCNCRYDSKNTRYIVKPGISPPPRGRIRSSSIDRSVSFLQETAEVLKSFHKSNKRGEPLNPLHDTLATGMGSENAPSQD